VSYNNRLGTDDLRIFEIGAVFTRSGSGAVGTLEAYKEEVLCSALIAGTAQRREWHAVERRVDFHDMKGSIESLRDRLRLDNKVRFSYDAESTSSDPLLGIEVESVSAGCIMQVPDEVLQMFDISVPVIYAELTVPVLAAHVVQEQSYKPVSRFQAVYRDIAVLVTSSVPASGLVDAIRAANLADLSETRVIDVFTHESLGAGRKSVALSLVFQPTERTLTEQEIADRMQRAHEALAAAWNAELRA
jgi:phenylalanyl-tRNA synthetase beta chain